MDFCILGPVEGSVDRVPLALGGPRQRALLAYLLVHANKVGVDACELGLDSVRSLRAHAAASDDPRRRSRLLCDAGQAP